MVVQCFVVSVVTLIAAVFVRLWQLYDKPCIIACFIFLFLWVLIVALVSATVSVHARTWWVTWMTHRCTRTRATEGPHQPKALL
jgi:hypothetical protein